jgi:hypothetical protein
LRRWEAIALTVVAALLTVAAVVDVGHRLQSQRRLAADKTSYVTWHRARSQPAGYGIKIRYGNSYDLACGTLGKKGNRKKCLVLRKDRSRPHPVVAGGYILERRGPGMKFTRSHCFGTARHLNGCRAATRRKA